MIQTSALLKTYNANYTPPHIGNPDLTPPEKKNAFKGQIFKLGK
jgi:hypothetical protein